MTAHERPPEVSLPWVEKSKVRGDREVKLLFVGTNGEPEPLQETVMARKVAALSK